MTNYYSGGYGGSAMKLDCPNCGNRSAHNVHKTDPAYYHWSDEHVEYFKRIAGRDITYRKRIRDCRICNQRFETIEMPFLFLNALMSDLDTKVMNINMFKIGMHELEEKNKTLHNVINEVMSLLKSVCNNKGDVNNKEFSST